MKIVVQRAKNAKVIVDEKIVGKIDRGLMLLVGITHDDRIEDVKYCAKKVANLRIFEDDDNKMNKSVMDIEGEILVVSQFTLAADCKKGTRPSFDNAQIPVVAQDMYEKFVNKLRESQINIKTGVFSAMMDVKLCNDGPVTIILEK